MKMVALDDSDAGKLLNVLNGTQVPSIVDGEKNRLEVLEKFGETDGTIRIKIYKKRWLQLGIFLVYAAVNSMQWIQLTIIGNIISRYYGVSSLAVDCTSIIFHITYVTLVFPTSYVIERVGLRWSCLIGATGTSIGSWIKFSSVSPDGFVWLFVGQAVVAMSQLFVMNGPPKLAANWFGPNEVASATAIACTGGLLGTSFLFLITPILIKNHENIEDTEAELSMFFLAVAIACTIVAIAMYFLFLGEPPLPPSEAKALQKMNRSRGSKEFLSSFRRILTNKSFLMLCNSYGLNVGYMAAASTLLNPLFLSHFKNGEADAGKLGLLLNFPGIFGSIIFGMILDKTKKFKALSIFIYCFSFLGEILFAVGLVMEVKWLVFASVVAIGIFTISYASISLELSAEATYPEPEELCSGILNLAQNMYGMIFVLVVGSLLRNYGDTAAHVFLAAILALGLILSIFTKKELRRQNAKKGTSYDPVAPAEALGIHRNGRALTPD